MCNSCAQPVQTVLKNRGHEYILCAKIPTSHSTHGYKPRLSTFYTHPNTHRFSTNNRALLYSVASTFSTLYTAPITRATKYINN